MEAESKQGQTTVSAMVSKTVISPRLFQSEKGVPKTIRCGPGDCKKYEVEEWA